MENERIGWQIENCKAINEKEVVANLFFVLFVRKNKKMEGKATRKNI